MQIEKGIGSDKLILQPQHDTKIFLIDAELCSEKRNFFSYN